MPAFSLFLNWAQILLQGMPTRTFSNPITEDVMGVNNEDGIRGDLVIAISVIITLLLVNIFLISVSNP